MNIIKADGHYPTFDCGEGIIRCGLKKKPRRC